MKMRTALLILAFLFVLGILAFLLAGTIEEIIIQPLLKTIWVLRGYYGSVHQRVIWLLSMIILVFLAMRSLRNGTFHWPTRAQKPEKGMGEIGQLAFWLTHKKGLYASWYLARVLADLAVEAIRSRTIDGRKDGWISGPGWELPQNMNGVLEIALRSTPHTFKRMVADAQLTEAIDIQTMIAYLESYVEMTNGH